jgi:hypothetical protein
MELKGNADRCLTYAKILNAHTCDGSYEIFKCNIDANFEGVKKSMIEYFSKKSKKPKAGGKKRNKKSNL